ncbi:UNC93-like protein MFSD11 [Trichoplax sp. H2]|nr:UNC93-like protein MFSD11 [Trichoplax sp. H2]|eukprot:RDD37490.1 UNC93-like protein MFSD11 [Trichoplax sp. H2]
MTSPKTERTGLGSVQSTAFVTRLITSVTTPRLHHNQGKMEIKLLNVILMGFAFMFIFTAFQTCSEIEQRVLKSAEQEAKMHNTTFTASGYNSLAIIYSVFAASNWLGPSVVSVIGPKYSMLAGAIPYCLFIASLIQPLAATLYIASALVGVGAGILWTAQGNFLTINSDPDTIARNSGIFWALLQFSLLFGNLYVFLQLEGVSIISDEYRYIIYSVLTVVCVIGTLGLLTLRKPKVSEEEELPMNIGSKNASEEGPWQAFMRSIHLLTTKEMLLLSAVFAYTGLELTFFSGVYPTCIGNARLIHDPDRYIGLAGIFLGIGEIIGGAFFGIFGKKILRHGRDPVILVGFISHAAAFFLIFMNIPSIAPISASETHGYLIEPSATLAVACSFLLGLGDSSFNTQIYSILGFMYTEDSAPAFALFKFVQSLFAAIAFFYSGHVMLQWQLLVLVISLFFGTLCFFLVEWSTSKMARQGYISI